MLRVRLLADHPTLRGHIRQAWSITQTYFRTHGVRARLSTIQAGLLDLNGRFAGASVSI